MPDVPSEADLPLVENDWSKDHMLVRVIKAVDDLGWRRRVIVKTYQLVLEAVKRAIVNGGAESFCVALKGRTKANSWNLQGD